MNHSTAGEGLATGGNPPVDRDVKTVGKDGKARPVKRETEANLSTVRTGSDCGTCGGWDDPWGDHRREGCTPAQGMVSCCTAHDGAHVHGCTIERGLDGFEHRGGCLVVAA